MNILIIWLSYVANIEEAKLGVKAGGDTHILELSKVASSIGHRVVMLCSISGELLLRREGMNVKSYQITVPFENILLKGSFRVGILYTLRSIGTLFARFDNQFDMIIAASHYPSDILSALFLHFKNPKSKVVVFHHGMSVPPENKLPFRIFSSIYNYLGTYMVIKICDLIFTINTLTRDFLLNMGVRDTKVILTKNGVNLSNVKPSGSKKIYDACFLGRLTKSKGTSDLVEIWKKVCVIKIKSKLVIVGDGPERKRINDLIIQKGLENNIVLLGFLYGSCKYAALDDSRLFVFPSHQESWGISIAEAMASGLPVVAYNLPVYKEVFEDRLITVPLGDVDAMTTKVIFLLENPTVASRIAEEGRAYIQRYDWKTVVEKELHEIQALCCS